MSLRPGIKLNNALKEVKKQMKKLQNQDSIKSRPRTHDASLDAYEIPQDPFSGSGKIMVSGTTVHGSDTKFLSELHQNDSLILQFSASSESRKVLLVLSDKSALISSAFPEETSSSYQIQRPPLKVDPSADQEAPSKKMKLEDNSEKTYEVRVKRGPWTYKSDQVKSIGKLSGEDLLNVRAQRVRDKFCWM